MSLTRRRILYICGGRSFYSQNPGRKISGVVMCWKKMGYDVMHVCGGDIYDNSNGVAKTQYGAAAFHRRWYRQIGILDPLIRTVSEQRDIRHDMAMAQHLEDLCDVFRPEIVWERSARLHCAGLIAARHLGVPYVLEWKDNIVPYRLSWFQNRARKMERRKNHEADFIVTESTVLRDDLIREGIEPAKIIVAHNAVDPAQFQRDPGLKKSIRRELGIADDTILVGYLGSYAWYHDTGRLVKAMDILRDLGAKSVRCLMVGAGREYDRTRLLAENRRLLNAAVIMRPSVPSDEVPGTLAALDIAVLPGSTDVICPIKIQEYMACELATLAPDYACNREVLDDGRTGMLFTPRNSQKLAAKICELADDSKMRLQMGWEARREVEHRFTWENTWGAALESVLKESGMEK